MDIVAQTALPVKINPNSSLLLCKTPAILADTIKMKTFDVIFPPKDKEKDPGSLQPHKNMPQPTKEKGPLND